MFQFIDGLLDIDNNNNEDLGAICHFTAQNLATLIHSKSNTSPTTATLYIVNKTTTPQELWTLAASTTTPETSLTSLTSQKHIRIMTTNSDLNTVAITGETLTKPIFNSNKDKESLLGVQYCIPVKAPRSNTNVNSNEVIGVLRVKWGIVDNNNGNNESNRGIGEYHKHGENTAFIAEQYNILKTASKYIGRTMHNVTHSLKTRTSLERTSIQLSQVQHRLEGAENAHASLHAHLHLERSLVRCMSAIATWPRKEIHQAEDGVEWNELFRIAEDLVTELLKGSSTTTNEATSATNYSNKRSAKLYVLDKKTEEYWRLDTPSVEMTTTMTTSMPSTPRIDATSTHLTTTVAAGRPSFGPSLYDLSKKGGGSLKPSTTTTATLNETTFVLVPVIDGDRNVVGILELDRPTLPLSRSIEKSISVLSDYGAHIALAMGRLERRSEARRSHREAMSRLASSRRRSTLLLAVEQLWGKCTSTSSVFVAFNTEIRRILYGSDRTTDFDMTQTKQDGMDSSRPIPPPPPSHPSSFPSPSSSSFAFIQSPRPFSPPPPARTLKDLHVGLYMTERGGRSLWTLANKSNERYVVPVGNGTLVGSAASYGESRVSSDGKCIAVVVRKLSGEVAAVVLLDLGTVGSVPTVGSTHTTPFAGHDIGSYPLKEELNQSNVLLTREDMSLLKIWTRHAAVAVDHYEALNGCVVGMGNASEALALLKNKNAELNDNVDRQTHSALRFCRDIFAAYGQYNSFIRRGSYDWMYSCQRRAMRMVDCYAVVILTYDERRDMLVGATSATTRPLETRGQKTPSTNRNSNPNQRNSTTLYELPLSTRPSTFEQVCFQQKAVLCETVRQWPTWIENDDIQDLVGENSNVDLHLMAAPLIWKPRESKGSSTSKKSQKSNNTERSQRSRKTPSSTDSRGSHGSHGSTNHQTDGIPIGVIIFARAYPSKRFGHTEKKTARLIGHVLGPMVRGGGDKNGPETDTESTTVRHQNNQHVFRETVQSRSYHQTLRQSGQNQKLNSQNTTQNKMAVFLNFIGQLNGIVWSENVLTKLVSQQGNELVVSKSIETFKLIAGGDKERELYLPTDTNETNDTDNPMQLISLSSNRTISLNIDSPAARAILYGQPVLSNVNLPSEELHVYLPCNVEKDLSLMISGSEDSTASNKRIDVVGVIEIIITDVTQEPDDAELSILTGWASVVGAALMRCCRYSTWRKKTEEMERRLVMMDNNRMTSMVMDISSRKREGCYRLFWSLWMKNSLQNLSKCWFKWKRHTYKSSMNLSTGSSTGSSTNSSTNSLANSSPLYSLFRELNTCEHLDGVVDAVSIEMTRSFQHVHISTLQPVGVGDEDVDVNRLKVVDSEMSLRARREAVRRCAFDGVRITIKQGTRPWLYEPIYEYQDGTNKKQLVGILEFGFLKSLRQRKSTAPWLEKREEMILKEGVRVIGHVLGRVWSMTERKIATKEAFTMLSGMKKKREEDTITKKNCMRQTVSARIFLRIATELLTVRRLASLNAVLSNDGTKKSNLNLSKLLDAESVSVFFLNSANESFTSTSTPASYALQGSSDLARSVREKCIVTTEDERCTYIPIVNVNGKNGNNGKNGLNGTKRKDSQKTNKSKRTLPMVIDICWHRRGSNEKKLETDKAGCLPVSSRPGLLVFLRTAIELVVARCCKNGEKQVAEIYNSNHLDPTFEKEKKATFSSSTQLITSLLDILKCTSTKDIMKHFRTKISKLIGAETIELYSVVDSEDHPTTGSTKKVTKKVTRTKKVKRSKRSNTTTLSDIARHVVEVDTADGHDDEWAPPKVWTLLQRNDVKYGEVYSDDPMFNTIKHKTIQIIHDDHHTDNNDMNIDIDVDSDADTEVDDLSSKHMTTIYIPIHQLPDTHVVGVLKITNEKKYQTEIIDILQHCIPLIHLKMSEDTNIQDMQNTQRVEAKNTTHRRETTQWRQQHQHAKSTIIRNTNTKTASSSVLAALHWCILTRRLLVSSKRTRKHFVLTEWLRNLTLISSYHQNILNNGNENISLKHHEDRMLTYELENMELMSLIDNHSKWLRTILSYRRSMALHSCTSIVDIMTRTKFMLQEWIGHNAIIHVFMLNEDNKDDSVNSNTQKNKKIPQGALWSIDDVSGEKFTVSKRRKSFHAVLTTPTEIHLKKGKNESILYIPLYHPSLHPSSPVEIMGIVRIKIHSALLGKVDKDGVLVLLDNVAASVAMLRSSQSQGIENEVNNINMVTMDLMENELEIALTNIEGYRNRVRSLEIALTETTMECDRLTWHMKELQDEDKNATDVSDLTAKKTKSVPSNVRTSSSSGTSGSKQSMSPTSSKGKSWGKIKKVVSNSSHGRLVLTSNAEHASSKQSMSPTRSFKQNVNQPQEKKVDKIRGSLSGEAVVERALAVQDMAKAFREKNT